MIYNFIVCAGNQTRFLSKGIKALSEIDGNSILFLNIKKSLNYCDKVIVVSSLSNYELFKDYESEKVDVIKIASGLGCGDAVLKALNKYKFNKEDTCFITWGDSLQINNNIYISLLLKYNNNIIVPVRYEENPYVQIIYNKSKIDAVKFSKYNENISSGYHDLSIFFGKCNLIKKYLKKLKKLIYINNKFINDNHNNEFLFLDIFNYIKCKSGIVIMNNCEDFSFNTIEQLENIKSLVKKV